MKDRLKIMGITSLIIANNAFGISCPNVKNAPLCPSSGSTLLDETYPTQAFVISNSPMSKGLQSDKVTSEYISKIAKSYDYENMPQVLVPVTSEDDFKQVVEKVKTSLQKNNIKADKIEKVLSQLSHVKNDSYTWQQDYFESFTDLKTGTPVLREFQSYITSRPVTAFAVDKMQEAGKACNIAKGETLVSQHIDYVSDKKNGSDLSFESGEMGGNVEGAPGGFCLTGDNHSKKLSTQYCGKEENIIQLQTSWLSVGHVDEIFKIIPSKFNDRRPAECQFSLMSASPKKALELMNSSKNKAKSFYSFSPRLSDEELREVKRSRSSTKKGSHGNKILCDYIENAIKNESFGPNKNLSPKNNQNKSVFMSLFIGEVHAGLTMAKKELFKCADYIDQVPNETINTAMSKDDDLIKLNTAIQESIDKDKQLIKSKILSRLPQCEKYFDFLDVPDLFYGSPPIEKNGKLELPKPSDVNSFLPNPTNSVLMNRTILLPESGNPSFDTYVEEELKKRKISTDKIDTWDYAHIGQGNIHCSSHSIPYCKPR